MVQLAVKLQYTYTASRLRPTVECIGFAQAAELVCATQLAVLSATASVVHSSPPTDSPSPLPPPFAWTSNFTPGNRPLCLYDTPLGRKLRPTRGHATYIFHRRPFARPTARGVYRFKYDIRTSSFSNVRVESITEFVKFVTF